MTEQQHTVEKEDEGRSDSDSDPTEHGAQHDEHDVSVISFFQQVLNNGAEDSVACFKLLVIAMLVLAALIVGNAAFVFTREEVNNDYASSFTSYSMQVVEVSEHRVATIVGAMISLKDNIISYALDTDLTWPFVTVADFEARHAEFLHRTRAEEVRLIPFVQESERENWEIFSVSNQEWIQESLALQGEGAVPNITEYIHRGDGVRDPGPANPFYSPLWQSAPATADISKVNSNAFIGTELGNAIHFMLGTGKPVLTEILPITEDHPEPRFHLLLPIPQNFDRDAKIVGTIVVTMEWKELLRNTIPQDAFGMVVVLANSCDQIFTFEFYGLDPIFRGKGDIHDVNYSKEAKVAQLSNFFTNEVETSTPCQYTLTVYPSSQLRRSFDSNDPLIYTAAVIVLFSTAILLFCLYDCCVERRQESIDKTAARSNAIVVSLFPEQVRERLLDDAQGPALTKQDSTLRGGTETEVELLGSKPIADLFPSTTVMFADIAGFTAWSSIREPSHVFTLLESIYNSFDEIAKRRRVFKVETIGDCYVAVCGVPQPRRDHAVVMARFALDCLRKMKDTVKKLQMSLGPDTADLSMRFGLHSGPVTGGVLRGERSRFQLFGDTVNTASRMESTGTSSMVQMSQETANLLIEADKSSWLIPRDEKILAKGKGELQTYWLSFKDVMSTSNDAGGKPAAEQALQNGLNPSNTEDDIAEKNGKLSDKMQTLVEWNTQMLIRSLKKIVAMRSEDEEMANYSPELADADDAADHLTGDVLSEVKAIIELPTNIVAHKMNLEDVKLDAIVETQLHHFVSTIASMYRNVPFHDFEHASHVTMSATKLLSRIVSPSDIDYSDMTYKEHSADALHAFTYGITSDPLTQFAIIFSALIHDVDHHGVPNAQLVKENSDIAQIYRNRSVAEQNSVDIAWGLLLEPCYGKLRDCIWKTKAEKDRFRQLVVNGVMATDIADKELGALRRARWEKAFDQIKKDEPKQVDINRKATIVIEHLIQASDVAHTMQHWHIYQKWNERLFEECYLAYKSGRAQKDPSEGWYKGEIGFFDFYIIPLAKKLKECGVFGASSDEYLNYALANRKEWEKKGAAIVKKFHRKAVLAYEIGAAE